MPKSLGFQFRARAAKNRRRDRALFELGYKLIYNPSDELQKKLRALSKVALDLFIQCNSGFSGILFAAIQAECPGAVVIPPSEKDFSFMGILCESFNNARIPSNEKSQWVKLIKYRLIFAYRGRLRHLRTGFDPKTDAMDDVFMDLLLQPLCPFRIFRFEVDTFVNSSRVEAGSVKHYSVASSELFEFLRKLLLAAPCLAFQNSFLDEYDRRFVKKGPRR
jgi:hypothetical protein